MQNPRIAANPNVGMSHPDPYQQLCFLRRDALEAFRRWAETKPPHADLTDELNATVGAFWGIACTVSAANPKAAAQ